MTTKTIGVGLLGLGTVGSAVGRAFADRGRRIDASAGRPVRLVAAAARDPRKTRDAGDVPVVTDPFGVLDDPEIAIVIEVIGGHQPAVDLLNAAFERGKHVVTANKEAVAREWNELHATARVAKRELRFEAAVGGAVPIIRGIRDLGAVRPRVLRGLLNGTTTYICSRLDDGASFEEALAEAQAKGYAEADPTNDVDGQDASYKLSILVSLLEGRHFPPDQVRRTSLRTVGASEAIAAAARGMRLRYLAVADFGDRATKCRVGPEEVAADSPEGRATGPTNVIRLESDLAATLTWSGPGAGGDATASAILADVIAIARTLR
ncbi:MAG TPA: homoserine dehydrogenase [Candidatus Saccharimonadales bacterium]|nr:homoserine dehydrogenase [Candidatus Saccharimonadales bacterium]